MYANNDLKYAHSGARISKDSANYSLKAVVRNLNAVALINSYSGLLRAKT